MKRVDLDKYDINQEAVISIPENIARKYKLVGIDIKDNVLIVAMVDPLNIFAKDDVKLFTKMDIEPMMATAEEINKIIDKFYSGVSTKKVLEEFSESEIGFIDNGDIEEEEVSEVATAPIVRLINSIIEQAVRTRASDIHIEPYQDEIRVRFRIDGDLREIMTLPRANLSAIVTRIKIIGKMDIAEKRIPQDGRIESKIGDKEIDMRISSLPTVYGEKMVIRLLDKSNFNFSKEGLGLSKKNLSIFNNILSQPYGMILATGPTGSGKTTTLYTVLKELNVTEKNVITVEDPVEYKLNGVNQVNVNKKTGLTFATGLRSILRQDPDIIMVGEIRDNETAEIAVRAAITGHLVLSTLHTNDSPSTIARLIDMGIEPYLVSSAVIGVVSQRLVKVLCDKCKMPYEIDYTEKRMLGMPIDEKITLFRPTGCNSCNQGFRGRTAVHEIMPIDESIRRLIDSNATTDNIREKAIEEGMTTLFQSALDLALQGKTTFSEVMRVGFTL
ncbi:GspE/PulE family protein [Paratissierella segnis]|jgi:type IV pilus assembly protein PilB|uniref:Type II/IV secretion system protein n=1 Tax=Paratissierella segnis TaxID=2763679 RepID=A0A926EY73_9FIRM|nr:GspE/PulE family protein [Paratissierella segnis]MBC8588459.1 type II/IV secretion system protein [Paratissierella segnis]